MGLVGTRTVASLRTRSWEEQKYKKRKKILTVSVGRDEGESFFYNKQHSENTYVVRVEEWSKSSFDVLINDKAVLGWLPLSWVAKGMQ